MNILPAQGSIKEIATIIECSKLLDITEDEAAAFNYQIDGQRATWDSDVDTSKEIKLKHEHITVIRKEIERLDSEGEVRCEQYETFVKMMQL